MQNIEEHIKDYIKEKSRETEDGIRVPLSRIAGELDYSTVTVWRAVQKLKGKRIIKVVKSQNKTEPDKIYYIGEEDTFIDAIDSLIQRTNGMLLTLQELRDKMSEQENIIFELTRKKN